MELLKLKLPSLEQKSTLVEYLEHPFHKVSLESALGDLKIFEANILLNPHLLDAYRSKPITKPMLRLLESYEQTHHWL